MDPMPDRAGYSRKSPKPSVPSSRRTFLKRFAAGLAIALPAVHTLVNSSPAIASAPCTEAGLLACERVYLVYQGHSCGRKDACPSPGTSSCVGIYYAYCTCSGKFCYSFTDVECSTCCDGR